MKLFKAFYIINFSPCVINFTFCISYKILSFSLNKKINYPDFISKTRFLAYILNITRERMNLMMKYVFAVLCTCMTYLPFANSGIITFSETMINKNIREITFEAPRKYLSEETISYIDKYKDIAVAEMYRSGIPASIILAQGIHESGNGQSSLALRSNNHFGIKCKSYWNGKKYYHKDDDYSDKGELLESCFRSYDEVIDSYVDHSNFLMYTSHYSVLFQYKRTDYVSWANGLKVCGYATDNAYAQKLIDKIELYDLHSFDLWKNPFELILSN